MTPESPADSPRPGARLALGLLLAINLFNYLDRYVLAAVLPRIEADPAFAGVGKVGLGWLTTAFMVSYMALSLPFGWLGDRMSRWLLVGVGVILWSLASGGSGLAAGFAVLLATRCLIGVGEAAYGPAAPSLLSDLYPVESRGRVMSVFYSAIPVGSALGYGLGGVVADLKGWGWRWAFYLVVPPGLLLGVWSLFMRDPPRGSDTDSAGGHAFRLADVAVFLRIPSYVWAVVGYTALTFAVGAVGVWMPTYVFEREARFAWTEPADAELAKPERHIPAEVAAKLRPAFAADAGQTLLWPALRERVAGALTPAEADEYREAVAAALTTPESLSLSAIGLYFGAVLAAGGLSATVFGGWLADRLRPRYPGAYFLVCAWSAFAAVPFILGVLSAPFPLGWALLFGAVFCLFVSTGPVNTVVADVAPPELRATAFAVCIFVIHLLGDALSPPIVGWIADHGGWPAAFVFLAAFVAAAGVAWLFGVRHLPADTERAPRLLAAPLQLGTTAPR